MRAHVRDWAQISSFWPPSALHDGLLVTFVFLPLLTAEMEEKDLWPVTRGDTPPPPLVALLFSSSLHFTPLCRAALIIFPSMSHARKRMCVSVCVCAHAHNVDPSIHVVVGVALMFL